jgi:hypothetical protein
VVSDTHIGRRVNQKRHDVPTSHIRLLMTTLCWIGMSSSEAATATKTR